MSSKKHSHVQRISRNKVKDVSRQNLRINALNLLDDLIGHLQVGGSTDEIMYFRYSKDSNFPKKVNVLTGGQISLQPVVSDKILKFLLNKLIRSDEIKHFKVQTLKSIKKNHVRQYKKKQCSFYYQGRKFYLPSLSLSTVHKYLDQLDIKYWCLSGFPSGRQALYFSRATLEVIYDDLPRARTVPINELLRIFYVARMWPIECFTKNAKHFSLVPMAMFLKNEYPSLPKSYGTDNVLIFEGKVRRMIKSRLISYNNHRAAHLPWSFLQGIKRGCYQIPEEFELSEYKKHANDLNNHYDESHDPVSELRSGKKDYIGEALRFVKPIKDYRLLEPSTSACWEKKRDEGGARQAVLDFLDTFGLIERITGYHLTNDMDIEALTTYDLNNPETRNKIIHAIYDLYKDQDYLNVMVHGIAEPLKFRKITKGEALPYWVARQFQKSMWNYLQDLGSYTKKPQFSPTGRPLETSDIYFLNDRKLKLEEQIRMNYNVDLNFDKWVSGDYSAATDLVDMRVTMEVFEEFAKRFDLNDEIVSLCRKVIGPQMIHYPERARVEPFLQENGQLMGSVLSFPILCIINLVALWAAMEEYISSEINMKWRSNPRKPIRRVNIPLKSLPVLVNGDDILFPANDKFYTIWKKWTSLVGFQLSLGKNYISSKYLTVNSKLFRVKDSKRRLNRYDHDIDINIVEIPYYQVGLLTGQSKLTARMNQRILPLWDVQKLVVQGAANPYRAANRFIHYNMRSIKHATRNGEFNLYAGHLYGGLGFKKPSDVVQERLGNGYYTQCVPESIVKEEQYFKIHVTRFQRRFAYFTEEEHQTYDTVTVDKPARIGIVQVNKPKPRFRDSAHNPVHPVLLPRIGPYRENVVHTRDYDQSMEFVPESEVLMDSVLSGIKPEMSLKVPVHLVKKARDPKSKVRKTLAYSRILKSEEQLPVVGFVKPKPTRFIPQEILERIHKFAYPEFHQALKLRRSEAEFMHTLEDAANDVESSYENIMGFR